MIITFFNYFYYTIKTKILRKTRYVFLEARKFFNYFMKKNNLFLSINMGFLSL